MRRPPENAAIIWQGKRVENRSWSTRYRGPFMVHSGVEKDRAAVLPIDDDPREWPDIDVHRAVLGIASLIDVHPDRGCCRPWGEPGVYHWVLDDVHPLIQPVSCPRGRQGLWIPDEDLLATVHTHEVL